jgi:excisionase family DNA binding protein
MTTDIENLLTLNEVAASLRIHKTTLRRWIREGKVTPVRLSDKVVRVRLQELERLIGGHQPPLPGFEDYVN